MASSLSSFDTPRASRAMTVSYSVPVVTKYFRQLRSHVLDQFPAGITPQQCTAVALIRKQRLNCTQNNPPEFGEATMAKATFERGGNASGVMRHLKRKCGPRLHSLVAIARHS